MTSIAGLATRFVFTSLLGSSMLVGIGLVGSMALAGPAGDSGTCLANGSAIGFNNEQVLGWKTSTPNSWKSRAHVRGRLLKVYPDRSGHHHFEIQIGETSRDAIEIIYNEEFGRLPNLNEGLNVEACGDYITSNGQAGPYPPSPDGAIIHWVHASPSPRHEDGFVIVNGEIFGQEIGASGPKRHRNLHGRGGRDF